MCCVCPLQTQSTSPQLLPASHPTPDPHKPPGVSGTLVNTTSSLPGFFIKTLDLTTHGTYRSPTQSPSGLPSDAFSGNHRIGILLPGILCAWLLNKGGQNKKQRQPSQKQESLPLGRSSAMALHGGWVLPESKLLQAAVRSPPRSEEGEGALSFSMSLSCSGELWT